MLAQAGCSRGRVPQHTQLAGWQGVSARLTKLHPIDGTAGSASTAREAESLFVREQMLAQATALFLRKYTTHPTETTAEPAGTAREAESSFVRGQMLAQVSSAAQIAWPAK